MTRNVIVNELPRALPDFNPKTVFDVGANVGQSVRDFVLAFPEATIYSFEPVQATYDLLTANVANEPRVKCFKLALGRKAGEVQITAQGTGTGNRVVSGKSSFSTESVQLLSGDEFCATHGIDEIDFLKIDAEGLDLDVLIGFHTMLVEERVSMLQVECSINPDNRRAIDLERFRGFVEPLGYRLFGILGNVRRARVPALGLHADAVFVSSDFVKKTTN